MLMKFVKLWKQMTRYNRRLSACFCLHTALFLRDICNKLQKRFVLDEDSDPPKIRAAQGHSVDIAEPVFVQVLQAETVPVAIHHTSSEGCACSCTNMLPHAHACCSLDLFPYCRWQAIQQSGELRRMARTHIHFATEPHHLRRNKWANVLLRLHLKVTTAICNQSLRPLQTNSTYCISTTFQVMSLPSLTWGCAACCAGCTCSGPQVLPVNQPCTAM